MGKNFYFLLHNWFNPGEYLYNPNSYLFVIFLVILFILFKTRSYDALDNENPYYKYDEILDDEYEAV
ncbi:hypothetical protein HYG86_01305 [Alkalicella caledoniensis]|uniref:Uncharacterized protein n=1 Tax=Alkalicella caledoniensis TaxID=2731377 RepID=A0A7G9W487_ALKCA|nr:hypothetical protein [Alkalicella caledoniensis]QNO13499.1 hypothetical protein HYG86_01305 [Alkalicella caledoniensis]